MKSRLVFIIAAVFVTGFIFFNSMQTAEVSTKESNVIVDAVENVVKMTGRDADRAVLERIVRKSAHVAEFALQGFLIAFCFTGNFKKRAVGVMVLGVMTACTDECIQLFSNGRAAMVQDACIDIAGTAVGMWAAWMTVKRKERRENTNDRHGTAFGNCRAD